MSKNDLYFILKKEQINLKEFSYKILKFLYGNEMVQPDLVVEINYKKGKFLKLYNSFAKVSEDYLVLKTNDFELDLNGFGGYEFFQLSISHIINTVSEITYSKILNFLTNETNFIYSYLIDAEFHTWQNMHSISYYDSKKRSHENLPKKSNGLPYPLTEEIIDISDNPGRQVFHKKYIEVIGNIMWLSPIFYEITGASKADIINASWIEKEELPGGVLKIKTADECFNDTTPKELQDNLRKILFPLNQK